MTSRALAPLVVMASASLGCNALWGEYRVEPTPPPIGGAGGEAGMAGAGGVGAAGSGGDAGHAAEGGSGGTAPCGNGDIDTALGEQCDDGNDDTGDGCVDCKVVCDGAQETLRPSDLHCYWLNPSPLSWQAGRTGCQTWGGDITSVTTPSEQSFVRNITNSITWIGGTDAAQEGQFAWANGEVWAYDNWASGEPNNGFGANEDCAEIEPGNGLWNDYECFKANATLCERPPPGSS